MLIKCPECELQVSDKALSCPHCGYPMKPEAAVPRKKKSNKRRRLPNGFGQISEIKGKNLRNPYRVMITVGKDPFGKPVSKLLKPRAYFETYNDAYAALIEYHKNPYDFDSDMTVKDLYEKWSEQHYPKVEDSSSKNHKAAWKYCRSIYDVPVLEIRPRHIKYCIEEGTAEINGKICNPSNFTKYRIKSLFNCLFDYAVEYEIVDKNYARAFSLNKEVVKELKKVQNKHIPFTEEEINTLWKNVDRLKYVAVILIQCYSGWRPKELCLLKIDNVDLSNWSFTGGVKTESGKDRIVPIHSKIRPLVKQFYEESVKLGNEYLISCDGKNIGLSYDQLSYRFKNIVKELKLNPKHKPHDGRKHFVTMAKKYKVDEYALKMMVGHEINDITESVYTEREFSWLQEEIEKIK